MTGGEQDRESERCDMGDLEREKREKRSEEESERTLECSVADGG